MHARYFRQQSPLHAETAYSTPCGYIQTILYAKATGYLGLGVHPEALVQHTLEEGNITISGNKVTITNPDVNFNDLMNENSAYVPVLHFGNEVIALPLNRDGWKKPGASWTKHSIKVDDRLLSDLVSKGTPPRFMARHALWMIFLEKTTSLTSRMFPTSPSAEFFPSTTNLPRHLPTSRCPANIKSTNNQPCSTALFSPCFHRLRSLFWRNCFSGKFQYQQ